MRAPVELQRPRDHAHGAVDRLLQLGVARRSDGLQHLHRRSGGAARALRAMPLLLDAPVQGFGCESSALRSWTGLLRR
jgi:hypothetical protein